MERLGMLEGMSTMLGNANALLRMIEDINDLSAVLRTIEDLNGAIDGLDAFIDERGAMDGLDALGPFINERRGMNQEPPQEYLYFDNTVKDTPVMWYDIEPEIDRIEGEAKSSFSKEYPNVIFNPTGKGSTKELTIRVFEALFSNPEFDMIEVPMPCCSDEYCKVNVFMYHVIRACEKIFPNYQYF